VKKKFFGIFSKLISAILKEQKVHYIDAELGWLPNSVAKLSGT
jgi:hypothetical protein